MPEPRDLIVYRYKPVNDGDGFVDVPRRDLRQSDVDALVGAALRHVTMPAVDPIYVLVNREPKTETKPVKSKPAPVKPKPETVVETATSESVEPPIAVDEAPKGGE